MKMSLVWTPALMLCVAFAANANIGRLGQILQEQRQIRAESERATGAYARFDHRALDRMQHAQNRIFKLLDGVDSLEQLNRQQQAELFNSLEEVKAVLAENERDRQICRREHKTGTTLRQTRCATVAERDRIGEGAREWIGDPAVCLPVAGTVSCGQQQP